MRRALACALVPFALGLGLGCSARELRLELPRSANARAAVLAYPNGDKLELLAVDLSLPGPWLDARFDTSDGLELVALIFERTLDQLELAPGKLVSAKNEDCGARALPSDTRTQLVLHVTASDEAQSWQPLAELPPAILEARFEGPCPCLRPLQILDQLELPYENARLLLAIDGRRVLATLGPIAARYDYFILERPDITHLTLPGPPAFPYGLAWFGEDQIWIGTRQGVVVGGVGRPFSLVDGTRTVGRVDFFAGPADDLLVTTASSAVGRIVQGQYHPIFQAHGQSSNQEPWILSTPSGEQIVSVPNALELAVVRDHQVVRSIEVPIDAHGSTAGTRLADGRILVGSGYGALLTVEGDVLQRVSRLEQQDDSINVLLPYGEGALVASDRGGIRQFYPSSGFCDYDTGLAQFLFHEGVALDDGYLFFTQNVGTSVSYALWLR